MKLNEKRKSLYKLIRSNIMRIIINLGFKNNYLNNNIFYL